jgi:hypothetical protein
LIELLACGLTTNPKDWENFRYHPTVWSTSGVTEGTKIQPAQIKAIKALTEITSNPSPVTSSALFAPIVSGTDIFGAKKNNASSRVSSTSASSKEELHVIVGKTLIANMAKKGKTVAAGASAMPVMSAAVGTQNAAKCNEHGPPARKARGQERKEEPPKEAQRQGEEVSPRRGTAAFLRNSFERAPVGRRLVHLVPEPTCG